MDLSGGMTVEISEINMVGGFNAEASKARGVARKAILSKGLRKSGWFFAVVLVLDLRRR